MPLIWERDDEHRCFIARVSGELIPEDVLVGGPTRRVGDYRAYALLLDMRESIVTASAADVRRVAGRIASAARATPSGPVAIVACDPAVFGMARMYEILMENAGVENIRVFSDIDRARAWLGC